MNTHDKYELPPLPQPFTYIRPGLQDGALFHKGHLQDYARAAIEADRKRRNKGQEPFGYFRALPFGWTDCADTDEGAIALYERPQAQGEPVGYIDKYELESLTKNNVSVTVYPNAGTEDVPVYVSPQSAGPAVKDSLTIASPAKESMADQMFGPSFWERYDSTKGEDPVRWPKVNGVGRDGDHARCLVVYFDSEPSDDQLRAVHNFLATSQSAELVRCDGNHGGPRCADPECWNDTPDE